MSRTRMVTWMALLSMTVAFVVGLVRNAGSDELRRLREKDADLGGRISELEAGLPPEKSGTAASPAHPKHEEQRRVRARIRVLEAGTAGGGGK